MLDELLAALGASRGIVSVVGAGGKKSLMRVLAERHPGRVCLTTTVRIPPLGPVPDRTEIVAPAAALPAALAQSPSGARVVFCAQPEVRPGRFEGVPAALVPALHAAGHFDLTLVKADGARMRMVKAPGNDEPIIAAGSTLIVPVASVGVLGEALDDRIAHRPELIARICGATPGEALDAAHLARLLVSAEGGRRDACGIEVVPMLTHADDDASLARAREVAMLVLELEASVSRVVVVALRSARPLREVLRR